MKTLMSTLAIISISGVTFATLNIQNPNFDTGDSWTFNDGGGDAFAGGYGVHNADTGTADALLNTTLGGGWSVIHQRVSLAGSGISGGDTVTMSALVTALNGNNEGVALLKLESWATGGGAALDDYEHVFTASDSGATESFDYVVHTDADELVVVVGATGGWAGATTKNGEFSFDNIQVVPEPATMGLALLSGGFLYTVRRFRNY